MNTNLQVFNFEDHSVRTVEIENNIWFVAKDVASTLGYINTRDAINSNCRKAKSLIDMGVATGDPLILKLDPQTKLIPESDVFRLTMKSTLKTAEKFQDWVVEEVLPSIRKTGTFSVNQNQLILTPYEIAGRQFEAEYRIWNLLQCPTHISQQEIVKSVRKNTGVDFSEALIHAAAQQNILPHTVMLEPTELGKHFNIGSAVKVNKILEGFGLQTNINGDWEPTVTGQPHCQKHAWAKKNKSGYNLKWNLKFLESYLNPVESDDDSDLDSDV